MFLWERFWDELGRPHTDLLSNGMMVERRYDGAGRLTYLSNEVEGRPISRFEYGHNPTGTISQMIKTFIRPEQSTEGRMVYDYTYDLADRLITASGESNFVYDELGNHLQRGGQFNELNQLLEDSEYTYAYTINGNLSTKTSKVTGESTHYTWDNQNKLTQVQVRNPDNSIKRSIQYKYDGYNRRIQKISSAQTISYASDNEDIVVEFDQNQRVQALYLHGPGIDEPITMVRDINGDGIFLDNEVFFYAKDHLNSVHTLTNKVGTPVQRYSYSAYGKTKVEKTNPNTKFVKNPFAYTSREWSEETGDYHSRARDLDPNTGRFLSLDPIGFRGGDSSLYRYTGNNPIIRNDPYGKSWGKVAVGAAAAAVALAFKYGWLKFTGDLLDPSSKDDGSEKGKGDYSDSISTQDPAPGRGGSCGQ